MSNKEWMEKGKYLPGFMRDFHDQKRLFKCIDEICQKAKMKGGSHYEELLPNWIEAHIYVIDFFLWFMARRGYTLQKSRAKFPFVNIIDDLNDFEKKQNDLFYKELAEMTKHQ